MSMNQLLQTLQNSGGLDRLASQFGLDAAAAGNLSSMLAPALATAARNRMAAGGAEQVVSQLKGEGRAQFFDNPEAASAPDGIQAGQDFLEQLFDSKDAPQALAAEAASRANIDPTMVMEFLPALAAVMQGGLQKQAPDSALEGALSSLLGQAGGSGGMLGALSGMLGGNKAGGASTGALGMLGGLLDADGNGSPLDDIVEKYRPQR
ncbi:MAG: DUF937 domain-containing protein [Pseudomonadota bacterium]